MVTDGAFGVSAFPTVNQTPAKAGGEKEEVFLEAANSTRPKRSQCCGS